MTSCGTTYGPLHHVPIAMEEGIAGNNAAFTIPGWVNPNAARYYEFPLARSVTKLNITVTGTAGGDFTFDFIRDEGRRPEEPHHQHHARALHLLWIPALGSRPKNAAGMTDA